MMLQGISKQWERVLKHPSAHSLETWELDMPMPLDPTLGLPPGQGSLISPGLLAALPGYKADWQATKSKFGGYIKVAPVKMAWLGQLPLLEKMLVAPRARTNLDWGGCPVKEGVRKLFLDGVESTLGAPMVVAGPNANLAWAPSLACAPSALFPNLVEVKLWHKEMEQKLLSDLLVDLYGLPSLRTVQIDVYSESRDGPSRHEQRVAFEIGPSGVRGVRYKAVRNSPMPDGRADELPAPLKGLANRLVSFEVLHKDSRLSVLVDGDIDSGESKFSLARFEACFMLTTLDFTFDGSDNAAAPVWHFEVAIENGDFSYFRVMDLSQLPASLERVVFRVLGNGDEALEWLPTVHLARGWQNELTQPRSGVAILNVQRV